MVYRWYIELVSGIIIHLYITGGAPPCEEDVDLSLKHDGEAMRNGDNLKIVEVSYITITKNLILIEPTFGMPALAICFEMRNMPQSVRTA